MRLKPFKHIQSIRLRLDSKCFMHFFFTHNLAKSQQLIFDLTYVIFKYNDSYLCVLSKSLIED